MTPTERIMEKLDELGKEVTKLTVHLTGNGSGRGVFTRLDCVEELARTNAEYIAAHQKDTEVMATDIKAIKNRPRDKALKRKDQLAVATGVIGAIGTTFGILAIVGVL